MTREDAVEHLKEWKEVISSVHRKAIIDMAIEALQSDMYCPNCGVRLVPENEYLEPTQTHRRLIDADALSKKLCETTIFIKDGEVFQRMINDAPTVQADKHGEWIYCEDTVALCVDGYKCSECGFFVPWDYEHKSPHFIEDYHFCPNCGCVMDMGKEKTQCL